MGTGQGINKITIFEMSVPLLKKTVHLKQVSIILFLVVTSGTMIFALLTAFPAQPGRQAVEQLSSDLTVKVTSTPGWLIFTPLNTTPKTGFIFYAEKNVEHQAYTPVLKRIASQGYLIIVPDMPFNQPSFGVKKAGQIIQAFPEIEKWVIGGHGAGADAAARFSMQYETQLSGLVLWAPVLNPSVRLDSSLLNIVLIYGNQDGIITPEQIREYQEQLPSSTKWTPLVGGNHSQFGDFGQLANDDQASITAAEQWKMVSKYTLELLDFSKR